MAEYGRNSVPFYVLYGEKGIAPVFPAEIQIPGIVLDV
jgi:hypothetical protein